METSNDSRRFEALLGDLRHQLTDLKGYIDNLSSGVQNQETEKDKVRHLDHLSFEEKFE